MEEEKAESEAGLFQQQFLFQFELVKQFVKQQFVFQSLQQFFWWW